MSRVLKSGENQVTCTYAAHCANVAVGKAWAKGVDVVKYKSQIDKITAHSAGKVIKTVDYLGGTNGIIDDEGMGYGNYVMILHDGDYVTLYAHLEAVYVREGQTVNQGDIIGLMGNTGNSFGAHLHFEVRKYKATPSGNLHDTSVYEWLDATDYLDATLPSSDSVSGAAPSPAPVGNSVKSVKTGAKIQLNDVSVYGSESGNSIGTRSGIYYVWSDEVRNGRVRMTNSAERVGVNKQVSFWVALADIGAAAEVKAETPAEAIPVAGNTLTKVKAGLKIELKDMPVYNTETGASVGQRSGTYYVWSEEVKNERVRMTNSAARVGERGQVSFWVNVAELTEP